MALNLKATPVVKSHIPDDAWIPGERYPSPKVFREGKRDGYNQRGNGSLQGICSICPPSVEDDEAKETELVYDVDISRNNFNNNKIDYSCVRVEPIYSSVCRTCWWKHQETRARNKIRNHELHFDECFSDGQKLIPCNGDHGPQCRAHRCYFAILKAIKMLLKDKEELGIIKIENINDYYSDRERDNIIGDDAILTMISKEDDQVLTGYYLSLLT